MRIMICDSRFLFIGFSLLIIFSACQASSVYHDTISNLTHTCNVSAMVVCVDVVVVNKTCVDPSCLIYSGGNYSSCVIPLSTANMTTGNLTALNGTSGNMTAANSTSNSTTFMCNATWIYPSNTTFCFNASSWNKTVCSQKNVMCKINATQCVPNPVVYVGGFFNLRSKDGFGNIPAAEIALKQINKNKTFLQDITLSLVAKQSTQSLLSYGTQVLYNYLHSGPTKLMLLLPQENDLARTVAAYAGLQRWGTLQFSYGTTDNSLASNKQLFPRFYRLNPLTITYNRLRAAFVEEFPDWKLDVGLLYYADSYYTEVNDDLFDRLKAKGIKVVANVGFKSDPAEALYILKEKNAHVIMTTFPYWFGKKMFCKAFQLGMYGPHYVWVTYLLMPFKFWLPKPSDNLGCTVDEMTCIAENHFSFYGATLYKSTNGLINQRNITFSETYNGVVNSTKNRTSVAPYVYDAIWTMADILHRASGVPKNKGKGNVTLNELSYNQETELLDKLAKETDFYGLTGRIRFYPNGNRKFEIKVLQIRSNGYGYVVGDYDEDKDDYDDKSNILWQGFKESEGGWAYRRTSTTYKWRFIELALFIAWCILAALGILYAIFCFVFVIKYRKERSIKYSSPTINVFIILGCLLNFIAVILYGVDYQRASESRMTSVCKARLWIFSLGFTFCIGGLWVKVWTLYQILIERKVYRKRRMEYWMFAIVLVLLVIDVIYLTTWTAIDGLYRSFETVTDQPTYKCFQKLSGNPFIATIWYIEICDCDNLALWSAIFLTYKALVLLFGAYMAWKVRKVYTRKLVDAQYCAILLLVAVPFSVLGLIFAFTLRLYPTPHYALLGIIIIIYTYIVLGFLYGHKIINIFCCPRNMIKVRSQDDNGTMRCCGRFSSLLAVCCAPVSVCLAACCCCACCPLNCCKVLWDALLHGPRKNRGTFVKENEKTDYQIGDMPSDKERQIIILQTEVEKREEELQRLRHNHRATLAAKHTQTMDYYFTNGGSQSAVDGRSNEGFSDGEDSSNNNKYRTGRPNYNRFKVYHRKLDFSHVGSKVDSGLDIRSSAKRGSLPASESGSQDLQRGSNDSEITWLQKTLSAREKELAELKAYLGAQDPSSSTECSSKIGSLASIGEEHNLGVPKTGNEEPSTLSRHVSSVAILIQSSDSDGDSKKTGSDGSIDEASSDVSSEQTVGLLGRKSTAVDQEEQLGILPDTTENEKAEESPKGEDKQDEGEKKEKVKPKVLTSAYGSIAMSAGAYVSHYNAKDSGGKFKKKVRQLNSFGIFARKSTNDELPGKNPSDSKDSSVANLQQTLDDSQTCVRPVGKVSPNVRADEDTGSPTADDKSSGNGDVSKSRGNVKIFNAPTDWSHVKSRIFDPNGQNVLKPSPSPRRRSKVGIEEDSETAGSQNALTPSPSPRGKSKVGIEDDSEQKTGGNATGDRNGVKIFNSPSSYSHVKSRLFDSNANTNSTDNLLKPSPSPRRRSKAGIEDDDLSTSGEADGEKKQNDVKIFSSSNDYSHVKSRLFDPNASGSQANSENLLKPSPTIRRKSKGGMEDEIDSDELSKRRGSVKIFNAPVDYSHVKSRLFDADSPSRRSSQVNAQDINDAAKKDAKEPGQDKENQATKSRTNVKILNAPSDYSHVRSRLFDGSNKNTDDDKKFKRKVQQMNAFSAVKKSQSEQHKQKKESTTV